MENEDTTITPNNANQVQITGEIDLGPFTDLPLKTTTVDPFAELPSANVEDNTITPNLTGFQYPLFPWMKEDVYVDLAPDEKGQRIIYLGDSPFKEDYEQINNPNEQSWFLETFLGFDPRYQISDDMKNAYSAQVDAVIEESGLKEVLPKEFTTIPASIGGAALINELGPKYKNLSPTAKKAFDFTVNKIWQLQKNTIDKLPIPDKLKKPIKKKYLAGTIGSLVAATSAGTVYDWVSENLDGDEETVQEIYSKLPENLKTEFGYEAIGFGINKFFGLGKDALVYGTAPIRKKLGEFYETGVKPVLADVVKEGQGYGKSFLETFGKLPLIAGPIQKTVKEQGPILRDRIDNIIESFAPRLNKNTDEATLFYGGFLKAKAEWKATVGAAYDNFLDITNKTFGANNRVFAMPNTRKVANDIINDTQQGVSDILKDSKAYKWAQGFSKKSQNKKLTVEEYRSIQKEINRIRKTDLNPDEIQLLDDISEAVREDLSSFSTIGLDEPVIKLLNDAKKYADDVFIYGVEKGGDLPLGKDFFTSGVVARLTKKYRQGTETSDFKDAIDFGGEGFTVNKVIDLPGAPGTKITKTFKVDNLFEVPLSKSGTEYYNNIWLEAVKEFKSPVIMKQIWKATNKDPNVFGSFMNKYLDDAMTKASNALDNSGNKVNPFQDTKNYLFFDPKVFKNELFGADGSRRESIEAALDLLHASDPKKFISGKQFSKFVDVLDARGKTFIPSVATLMSRRFALGSGIGGVGALTFMAGFGFLDEFATIGGILGVPTFLKLRGMAKLLGDPKRARAFYKAMDETSSYKTRYANGLRLLDYSITEGFKNLSGYTGERYNQAKDRYDALIEFRNQAQDFYDNMPDNYDGTDLEQQSLMDIETLNAPANKGVPVVERGSGEIPSIQPINIPQVDFASLGGGQGGGATNPQTMAGLESVGMPLFQAAEGGIVDLYESKKFKKPQVVA
jgi:hypothetical protein